MELLNGWPPYSPDLNVIETLWGMLANKVQGKAPYGVDELQAFVQDAFDAIPQVDGPCALRGVRGPARSVH